MLLANAFVDLVQTTKKRRFTRSSKTGDDRDGRAMSLYVHPSRARFERDVEVHEACTGSGLTEEMNGNHPIGTERLVHGAAS